MDVCFHHENERSWYMCRMGIPLKVNTQRRIICNVGVLKKDRNEMCRLCPYRYPYGNDLTLQSLSYWIFWSIVFLN